MTNETFTIGPSVNSSLAASTSGGVLDQVEKCLERIGDPNGEGKLTFRKVWADGARAVARSIDALQRHDYRLSQIAGMPISVKDLFDVKGERTQAASRVRDDALPAEKDAIVVRRLKQAGAVLVGSTNMTEFAYSVVGINQSFGTPGNPWDRKRIPGGSSSGAAVSVADGMALGAIGSDTIGSIRVPAALCGVVGFKPTQRRVPLDGSIPLSPSLDSIGPIANSVSQCAALFSVISGEPAQTNPRSNVAGLRLAIPQGFLVEGLDQQVGRSFDHACAKLSSAGVLISDANLPILNEVHASQGNRIIQSAEAYAWHRDLLETYGHLYDPNIRKRIAAGSAIDTSSYLTAIGRRRDLIRAYDNLARSYDALILPTVAIVPPTLENASANEDHVRTLLLRNTALFNFLDCCAISIPIHEKGAAPVGLMIVGRMNKDWPLLTMAEAIERTLLP